MQDKIVREKLLSQLRKKQIRLVLQPSHNDVCGNGILPSPSCCSRQPQTKAEGQKLDNVFCSNPCMLNLVQEQTEDEIVRVLLSNSNYLSSMLKSTVIKGNKYKLDMVQYMLDQVKQQRTVYPLYPVNQPQLIPIDIVSALDHLQFKSEESLPHVIISPCDHNSFSQYAIQANSIIHINPGMMTRNQFAVMTYYPLPSLDILNKIKVEFFQY